MTPAPATHIAMRTSTRPPHAPRSVPSSAPDCRAPAAHRSARRSAACRMRTCGRFKPTNRNASSSVYVPMPISSCCVMNRYRPLSASSTSMTSSGRAEHGADHVAAENRGHAGTATRRGLPGGLSRTSSHSPTHNAMACTHHDPDELGHHAAFDPGARRGQQLRVEEVHQDRDADACRNDPAADAGARAAQRAASGSARRTGVEMRHCSSARPPDRDELQQLAGRLHAPPCWRAPPSSPSRIGMPPSRTG